MKRITTGLLQEAVNYLKDYYLTDYRKDRAQELHEEEAAALKQIAAVQETVAKIAKTGNGQAYALEHAAAMKRIEEIEQLIARIRVARALTPRKADAFKRIDGVRRVAEEMATTRKESRVQPPSNRSRTVHVTSLRDKRKRYGR